MSSRKRLIASGRHWFLQGRNGWMRAWGGLWDGDLARLQPKNLGAITLNREGCYLILWAPNPTCPSPLPRSITSHLLFCTSGGRTERLRDTELS